MEKKLSSKDWTRGLRALIGYGYEPGKAIWLLLVLWLLGAGLCWYSGTQGVIVPTDKEVYSHFDSRHELPGYYPGFQPLIFSLENTFPLVKLGQAEKWQPDPRPTLGLIMRWFVWIQVVLGWLFATLFGAAVLGIVQHD
jgi:hypothetical protein